VIELGRVHLGDCLERLHEVDDGSVDMVFADLPYGVTANAWDKPLDMERLWPALWRVCARDAAMIFTAVQPFASDLIVSNRKQFRYEMIWKKNMATGFLNAAKRPLRIHENVLLFWRETPPYYPQKTQGHDRVRVTPSKLAERPGSSTYGAVIKTEIYDSTERHPTTVLEMDMVELHDVGRRHATQKPEQLIEWFIRSFTDPGALVLDPTAGSGSTLCAAKSCGRRCVGFDLDPKSVEVANDALMTRFDFASGTP
jgi:site-specific DNA-methyltransferase (adenine-specific)